MEEYPCRLGLLVQPRVAVVDRPQVLNLLLVVVDMVGMRWMEGMTLVVADIVGIEHCWTDV